MKSFIYWNYFWLGHDTEEQTYIQTHDRPLLLDVIILDFTGLFYPVIPFLVRCKFSFLLFLFIIFLIFFLLLTANFGMESYDLLFYKSCMYFHVTFHFSQITKKPLKKKKKMPTKPDRLFSDCNFFFFFGPQLLAIFFQFNCSLSAVKYQTIWICISGKYHANKKKKKIAR